MLSERLREFESKVLQHDRKHCLAVGSETLLKVLRDLVDDLESSEFGLESASVHGQLLLSLTALEFQVEA